MPDRVFNVGDRVRIRQWEDMAEEFGTDGDDIYCEATFVDGMRYLCGKEFVVSGVDKEIFDSYKYMTEDPAFASWSITGDMLEPAEPEPDDELIGFNPEEFLDALTDWI